MRIARHGFDNAVGLGVGRSIREHRKGGFDEDLDAKVRAYSAAASDARMAGAPLPVMSSAGSGNHGITATLPVYLAGLHYGKSRDEIARAVVFSHLSTSFIKSRMGRLSPVCGCAVAAGGGAAAGIAWMLSGEVDRAVKAMELVLGNLVGMICDGAKETCSLKVCTGAGEALQAAILACEGAALPVSQGVIDIDSIEQTVQNAVSVNSEGMPDMDRVIIGIMRERLDSRENRPAHPVS
jgi:L-cysteine desulfidase